MPEFKYYKPGQGKWTRWTAGVLMALFALFGAFSLYEFIDPVKTVGGEEVPTMWGTRLANVSVGDAKLTIGFLISFLVFVAACTLIYLFVVNNPRPADFMIDTESEMHKVSWPPRHEYLGSSLVVIISVFIIGAFVAIVDVLFQFLLTKTGVL